MEDKPFISMNTNTKDQIKNDTSKHALIKLIAKRCNEIIEKIKSLNKYCQKPSSKTKQFIAPIELVIYQKRWEEFYTFAKRSIYRLRGKVSIIFMFKCSYIIINF